MSLLRWSGILFAVLLCLFAYGARRGRSLSRGQTILIFLISLAIGVVAMHPDSLDLALQSIGFPQFEGYRLLALSVCAILLLFAISLRTFVAIAAERNEIDNVIETIFSPDVRQLWTLPADQIPDVLVLIPAFNEAENLKVLLPQIPSEVMGLRVRPLVISDGSTDDTVQQSRDLGALVLNKNVNRGGGAALKSGYFVANLLGAPYIITMDADGQHSPEDFPTLLKPLLEGGTDLASGSRVLGSGEKNAMIRKLGIRFFSTLISILLRKRITDPSNAYRAFSAPMVRRFHLREQQFHTTELIIEAVSKGYRFVEVPVQVRPRQEGKTKKPKSLQYGWFFLRTILRTYLRC